MKKKLIKRILILFFTGMIIVGGVNLYSSYMEYKQGTDMYNALADQFMVIDADSAMDESASGSGLAEVSKDKDGTEAEEDVFDPLSIQIDFDALKETCDDVVAWIYCPDTVINYPIVQADDNAYYLYRLMNGASNIGGTLFMDFRNASDFSDWNSIVYGHNMKNGSMFAILPDYIEQEFYDEHPLWYLYTEDGAYVIELMAGYVTPYDSDIYMFPFDEDKKESLLNYAMRRSSFKTEHEVKEGGRIITLSTCVYDYENARYVLVGILEPLSTES